MLISVQITSSHLLKHPVSALCWPLGQTIEQLMLSHFQTLNSGLDGFLLEQSVILMNEDLEMGGLRGRTWVLVLDWINIAILLGTPQALWLLGKTI